MSHATHMNDFKEPTNRSHPIEHDRIQSLLFVEYSLFYGALLQKRPVILRNLQIVATPHDLLIVATPHDLKF